MNCPLCTSSRSVIARRTNLSELKGRWLASFGFDPFPKDFVSTHIDKKRCASCHLEFFDPPLYGDADFYAKISKHPWYYEENKWEFDVAAEFISKLMPKNLLEIGCGEGCFLEKILPLGLDVEGVDINKDAIKICKVKGLNAEALSVFGITKSYDMVVLFEVLEHLENAKELIGFVTAKLIRPGGHLVIAVPNPEGYFKELGVVPLDMPPHHNSGWGLRTFEYLSAQFGLQLIEHRKEPLHYVHYVGLLNGVLAENFSSSPISFKQKIARKLRSMLVGLLAPLTYLSDREKVDGQTHLVIFKKI
jgi:2-polyprenyl-3-methyl-5-hydroxy-6-metoxy-1,4-benzoquinol methylase